MTHNISITNHIFRCKFLLLAGSHYHLELFDFRSWLTLGASFYLGAVSYDMVILASFWCLCNDFLCLIYCGTGRLCLFVCFPFVCLFSHVPIQRMCYGLYCFTSILVSLRNNFMVYLKEAFYEWR